MPNVKNNALSQETRRRLIDAAGQVFADLGFHAATTRHITQIAKVNGAAVNYHFRDKAELYTEVVRHAHAHALESLRMGNLTGPPQRRLEQFIHGFIHHLLNPDRPRWHVQLCWRELLQDSPALDHIVEELAKPHSAHLRQIVADILHKPPMHPQVILASASVVSQCLFHLHHQPVLHRLYPHVKAVRDPKAIARHITRFSLAALKSLRRAN